jgi:hypothetical protein
MYAYRVFSFFTKENKFVGKYFRSMHSASMHE